MVPVVVVLVVVVVVVGSSLECGLKGKSLSLY